MNPTSGFLHNVKNNRFLLAIGKYVIYLFDNEVDIIASEASDGLDFVAQRSDGILFGELKHDVDLVFELVAFVGFAEDVEFVRGGLLDHLELIQVDVCQRGELVLLMPQVLHFH